MDRHQQRASKFFQAPVKQVTEQHRSAVRLLVFRAVYGGTSK